MHCSVCLSLQGRAKVDPIYLFLNLAPKFLNRVYLRAFLTSGLDGVLGWRHVPAAVALRGKSGRLVGRRAKFEVQKIHLYRD
jgi:hypothetical protein